MRVPDVLVVGGGPAGSTVAGLLAREGWSVALLDRARFPRPKACGECLNPGALEALKRLDLLDALRALNPRPLKGWDIVTGSGLAASGRFGDEVGPGLAVPRERLDAALLDEARRRGVRVEEGVTVTDLTEGASVVAEPGEEDPAPAVSGQAPGDGGRPGPQHGGPSSTRRDRSTGWRPEVRTRETDGTEGRRRARIVVGADGLRSRTARALGGPARPPRIRKLSLTARVRGTGPSPDRGRLVLADEGTVGLAPVGPSLWNLTVVVDAERHGREVALDSADFLLRFADRLLDGWDTPPRMVAGPWGSGNFDVPVRRIVGHGVLLVGDAAGYFDPLTGQGMYRAFRSAELAARTIDTALRTGRVSEDSLKPYARRLRRAFRPGRRVQRLVEAVVSRPTLRDVAFSRLGAAPTALDALVRVTGDARPARSLLRPSVWGPALLPPRPST